MGGHSVTIDGAASAGPQSGSASRQLSQVSLAAAANYQMVQSGAGHVVGTQLQPFPLLTGALQAARLVHVRSVGGASFVLLLTSQLGTAQVPFSDQVVLHTPAGAPYTAAQLVGTGDVEYLLAGDSTGGSVPPVPPGAAASWTLSDARQQYVVGQNEQVVLEWTADLSLLGSVQAACALTALTYQTLGGPGLYYVRVGGTQGAADGLIVATLSTSHASYPSVPDEVVGAPFANPGAALVKVTCNGSQPGEVARVRGAGLLLTAA